MVIGIEFRIEVVGDSSDSAVVGKWVNDNIAPSDIPVYEFTNNRTVSAVNSCCGNFQNYLIRFFFL